VFQVQPTTREKFRVSELNSSDRVRCEKLYNRFVRLVLILMAVTTASAQPGKDARRFLESISKAVHSSDSLRVEGTATRDVTGDRTDHEETSFVLATQGPLRLSFHANGPNSVLQVCDGTSFWNYSEASNSYTKSTADIDLCSPLFARWGNLTEYLVDANIIGNDHSEFEGHSQECKVIVATCEAPKPLWPGVPTVGRLTRSLCIDPVRHLVLREQLETPPDVRPTGARHYSMTTTYSRIELNASLDASLFQFDPPSGSQQVSGSHRTTPPALTSKREPKYTSEARKAGLQGTVLMSLVVGTDGVPQNVKVLRGLGLGLDEKAIEAVEGWRFKPATRDGEPLAMPAQVEVNFQLHNK
jgi:TonB family protein